MARIHQIIGDSLHRSWYILIPLLLVSNGLAYSLPLLSNSSYQIEDSEMMIMNAHQVDNQLHMTYQTYDNKIYVLSNSSIFTFNHEFKQLWSYNLSDKYNLFSQEYTPLKLLLVDQDGVYVSYIVENEVSLDLKLGLFSKGGEINSWNYSHISSKYGGGDSYKFNYISTKVHLNTGTRHKVLTYSVNLVGYYYEYGIIPSSFCDSKIVRLHENSLEVLLEETRNRCSFSMHPDSYILDGFLYVSFNQTIADQNRIFYKYDPEKNTMLVDTRLNDTINGIRASEDRIAFKKFFVIQDKFYTIWYYSSDAFASDLVEGYFGQSFIYIYEGTSLVAELNMTSYLDDQFQDRNNISMISRQSSTFCSNVMNTLALLVCYENTTYQVQALELSPRNYLLLSNFYYNDNSISLRVHTILEFIPFDNELRVHNTLLYAPDNLIEYYFMQIDKLGSSKLLLYGTTLNTAVFQSVFQVLTLEPDNVVGWLNSSPFLPRYFVPSVILTLIVVLIRYPRHKLRNKSGEMYPQTGVESDRIKE